MTAALTAQVPKRASFIPLAAALQALGVRLYATTKADLQILGDPSFASAATLSSTTLLRSIARRHGLFSEASVTTLAAMDSWFEFSDEISSTTDAKRLTDLIQRLDNFLKWHSFLVGYHLSLADWCVWQSLLGVNFFVKNKSKFQNVDRWCHFMEALPAVVEVTKLLEEVKQQQQQQNNASDQGSFELGLEGAIPGQVVTRFPPEPSGYLHIGHAKAAILNEYYARHYQGKLILRFDDTNPSKEKCEFEESIIEDLRLLNITADMTTHTSDHFELIYKYAIQMIEQGDAYCDDTELEQMRKERGEGIASKHRNTSVQENLRRFQEMKVASAEGQAFCLRAKMSVDDPNKALRDPVMYRCNLTPHHRTLDRYKMYPTYDFACPIVDSIEGVTHALRTNEYRDRNPQYLWFLDRLKLRKPQVCDYSRLNFVYTLLSKRKLQKFVDTGKVTGWDDPRFPTVRGIRRRGMTIEALRQYIVMQGASSNVLNLEWDKIWTLNKKVLDPKVPRFTCLVDHVKFRLIGKEAPSQLEIRELPRHKKADLGSKKVAFSQEIYLDASDASQLQLNEEITLMDWGNAFVRENHQLELNLSGDFKKTEKKLTWLAAEAATVPVTLRDLDYLIVKDKLEEDDDYEQFLNPVTVFDTAAVGDENLLTLQRGDCVQFERRGYYICDSVQPLVMLSVPDGRKDSVALKSSLGQKAVKVQVKKEKSSNPSKASSTNPISMYVVPSYTASMPLPDISQLKMYRVKPLVNLEQQQQTPQKSVSLPVVEKAKKSASSAKPVSVPAVPVAVTSDEIHGNRLDLRVGVIVSCQPHPDADSLYVEQIDLGEATPRTVVSGLVQHIPLNEMQGARVIVVCNLKPASMRGIASHGMVLVASDDSAKALIVPPADAVPGTRVTFGGVQSNPDEQINPKKKIFEQIAPEFKAVDGVAHWRDLVLMTTDGKKVTTGRVSHGLIK